jgi:hypothetical protein
VASPEESEPSQGEFGSVSSEYRPDERGSTDLKGTRHKRNQRKPHLRREVSQPIGLAHRAPGSGRPVRRLALVAGLAVAAFLFGIVPSPAAAKSFHGRVRSAAGARHAAKQDPNRGTLSTAASRAIHRGYLVPNKARYDRQKAGLTRRAASRESLAAAASGPLASSIVSGRSFQGINNPNVAPPDETSAVGTTRYVELVNTNLAIYDKTSNSPISTGSINSLTGAAATDSVFDVQVIWDPTTSRFYYAADDVRRSSQLRCNVPRAGARPRFVVGRVTRRSAG